ncbi:MAG: helix-turn-helix domain-containing protein [Clostridia bacterium]|nr:helix-turn-helix domain-containing protein [Clostridia bacterium]
MNINSVSNITEKEDNRFIVIPAAVRSDRRLSAGARLLYGDIAALTMEKGYCWATNTYLAEIYSVRTETISNWISQLEEFGYIEIKYSGRDRIIRLCEEYAVNPVKSESSERAVSDDNSCGKNHSVHEENRKDVLEKTQGSLAKNRKHNKSYNNSVNKSQKKKEASERKSPQASLPTLNEVRDYVSENNIGINPEVFFMYYQANGWKTPGGRELGDWKAQVKIWELRERNTPKVKSRAASYEFEHKGRSFDANFLDSICD